MSRKQLLYDVFMHTLDAITPQKLIAKYCSLENETLHVKDASYNLKQYKRIIMLGSGKAVIPMAEAMEKLLHVHLDEILLVGPYGYESNTAMPYIQSSHPLPSDASIEAAKAIETHLETLDEEDLFIYLLSGGNSALVERPQEPISLEDFQKATTLMLHGGMSIDAINCVRKHISAVKGGKLATKTKATGIVLVLSDVIGDDLHAIGSAPFYYDSTTFEIALSTIASHELTHEMPQSIMTYLQEGSQNIHAETPKQEAAHITHHILGSNLEVQRIAESLLKDQGIITHRIEEPLQDDTAVAALRLTVLAASHHDEACCYILGGESTVNVKGNGKGGRNQHLALTMLLTLEGKSEITLLCAATDGIDGNSKAAGALIDTHSRIYAMNLELDPQHYFEHFDSNTFFAATGELLECGPTHNNLLDIVLMFVEKSQ